MIADELRALADWIETQAALQQKYGMIGTAHILKAAEVRALADKLQDKVVVRPQTRAENSRGITWVWLDDTLAEAGTTEAEAIANLQTALDAAERGDG